MARFRHGRRQNRHGATVYNAVLVVRFGTLGIEHFHSLIGTDQGIYRRYDDDVTQQMLQVSSQHPDLYRRLSFLGKFLYSELNPSCVYD